MQPEAKIVKRVRERLERNGLGRCFKIHGEDSGFQEVGIPDLLCCYRGRFVGLEVKQPGESPSPVQKVVLYEIVKSGGYAAVVSTVGQVEDLLADIDREADSGIPLSRAGRVVSQRRLLERSLTRHGGK